jgi:hypothetical protein
VNTFFNDIINIKIFCKDETREDITSLTPEEVQKFDQSEIVMIKNGSILKRKRVKYLSEGYLNFLLEKFNLRKHIESTVEESIYHFKN